MYAPFIRRNTFIDIQNYLEELIVEKMRSNAPSSSMRSRATLGRTMKIGLDDSEVASSFRATDRNLKDFEIHSPLLVIPLSLIIQIR